MQCVLPAGVEIYSSGVDVNDVLTFPRCYPIVLTGIFCDLYDYLTCLSKNCLDLNM